MIFMIVNRFYYFSHAIDDDLLLLYCSKNLNEIFAVLSHEYCFALLYIEICIFRYFFLSCKVEIIPSLKASGVDLTNSPFLLFSIISQKPLVLYTTAGVFVTPASGTVNPQPSCTDALIRRCAFDNNL